MGDDKGFEFSVIPFFEKEDGWLVGFIGFEFIAESGRFEFTIFNLNFCWKW